MQARTFSSLSALFAIPLLLLVLFQSGTVMAQTKAGNTMPSYKFGGFLQQQAVYDETPGTPVRLSIYRARLGVTGAVSENIRVNLLGGYTEPPDNTPRLVNAFIDFDIHPLLQIRTGQFLLPFGLEGPEVIIFNPAIERSAAIRRLNTFALFRDIGIQFSGRAQFFNYAVAVVNGRGANQVEDINPKDILGRLGFTPAENLEFGASGHMGWYQPDPASGDFQARYRAGVDVVFTSGPFFSRGEFIIRRDDQPGGSNLVMGGGYLLAGWQFIDNLEAFGRYEYFEPDTAAGEDNLAIITAGASYYFVGNTRLSVNYEFRDDDINPNLGNLLTVQMQVAL